MTRGGENICEKVGQLQLHKVGIRGKLGEGGRSWGLVSMGMWIYRCMVVCVYGVGLIWEIDSYGWVQHAEMAWVQASALQ